MATKKIKDPLEILLKSPEWMDGYRVGVEYGISKERKYPQKLNYAVKVENFIIKKFASCDSAFKWACWNYKKRIDYFTIVELNKNNL